MPGLQKRGSRQWIETAAWSAVALALAGALLNVLTITFSDPDLWGHVRYGQLTLAAGTVTSAEPFSYLSDTWINHEWAAEVVFAALYDVAGPRGLVLLKVFLSGVLTGLLLWRLHSRGLGLLPSGLLVLGAAALMLRSLATVRPQLFTLLFFAVTLLLLEAAERTDDRSLVALPVVFAVWINFHGGVLAGLGVVFLWGLGRAWERSRQGTVAERVLGLLVPLGLLAGCGAAMLLNPYGLELPRFLLETATGPRPDIVEWQALELHSIFGAGYVLFLGIGVAALYGSGLRRRAATLAPLLGTAVLPLLARRHLPLFLLTLLVLGAPHLGRSFGTPDRAGLLRWRRAAAVWRNTSSLDTVVVGAVLILLVGAGGLMAYRGASRTDCLSPQPGQVSYPTAAVDLLRRSGTGGRLAVAFNWGQYAIWHLEPRFQIAVDGRRETVYSPDDYARYLHFAAGVGDWEAFLREDPPDAVLMPTAGATANLLVLHPDWLSVYRDASSTLFVPTDSPLRASLTTLQPEVDDRENGCFPR